MKTLRSLGIQPDIIICRTEVELDETAVSKISLFCDIERRAVLQQVFTDNVYELPLTLHQQGLDHIVAEKLGLPAGEADISGWNAFYQRSLANNKPVEIALVGKYTSLPDAYISLVEALHHCGLNLGLDVQVRMLAAQELEEANVAAKLAPYSGLVIPDGFGVRGTEGMIAAAGWARQNSRPCLAIGMGMHAMAVEYTRNVAGLPAQMPETGSSDVLFQARGGGSLESGLLPISLADFNSHLFQIYGDLEISERHRHRYVLREDAALALQQAGMVICARSAESRFVEALELPASEHPWFVGCQYHPEFLSRPEQPHPLISNFLKKCLVG